MSTAVLLPHELEWAKLQLEDGIIANNQASDDMRNAIENGNQWHDNAEYDEVIERMKRIDTALAPIAKAVKDRTVVDYPSGEASLVLPGSLVDIEDDYETYRGLLVGLVSLDKDGEYEKRFRADFGEEGGFEVIGCQSPLGTAVLGHEPGQKFQWDVAGRSFEANVLDINNQWCAQVFGSTAINGIFSGD